MFTELPPLQEEPKCSLANGLCLAWPWHKDMVNSLNQRDLLLESAMELEYDGESELLIEEKQSRAKDYDHDAQMSMNQIRGYRYSGKLCKICPYAKLNHSLAS